VQCKRTWYKCENIGVLPGFSPILSQRASGSLGHREPRRDGVVRREEIVWVWQGDTFGRSCFSGGEVDYHLLYLLGSRQVVCEADGSKKINPDGEMKYSTFGEHGGGAEGKYSFTGKQKDSSTGLTYFNARFYMPELGRFLTMDPIKDGVNWYVYAVNNPLRYVDENGLEAEECDMTGTNTGNNSKNNNEGTSLIPNVFAVGGNGNAAFGAACYLSIQ
jgi:RHS repeat-associated protein